MNQNNRQNFRPSVREIEDVTRDARRDARRGTLAGGLIGGALGRMAGKKKLAVTAAGTIAGALVGHDAGSQIGRRQGARDVVKSRKALLQNNQLAELRHEVNEMMDRMAAHDLDRNGNAMEPGLSGQHPVRSYPHAKGPYVPGNGIDDQEAYEMSPLRQKLTEIYGVGIVSALADDELSEENCRAKMAEVIRRQSKADGPRASSNTDPEFERHFLASKLGDKAVSEMPDSLVHCHFLSAQRRGLIELEDAEASTSFAILNRERTAEGTFAPEGQVTDQAVQDAYSPTRRRTGISASVDPDSAAEGLATATRHARKLRKAKIRGATGGIPTLPGADFAARAGDDEQGHGARNSAIAGTAGAGLTIAGILAARRLRRGRVPRLTSGTAALPPRTSPPTYDVETQVMSRRSPFLTSLATRSCAGPGKYPLKRRALRGKKQPGVPKVAMAGKTNLAFLIADDAPEFRITPQAPHKLPPGVKRRVPLARTRAEVLKRLKAITALSREFGVGSVVAEGLVDALGVGAATTPKKKKVMVDKFGNVLNPTPLPDPGTSAQSSFTSAIERLHSFGIGAALAQGAAKYLPEAAVIGSADLVAERANAAIEARKQKRQKRLMRQAGGIQAVSPPGPTTMAAILGTLTEFDSDGKRDAARRHAATLGASGLGATAGAYGALATYKPGRPVQPGEDVRGKRVYVKRKSVLPSYHVGTGGEEGVVHRTPGRDGFREVKGGSFRKIGKGGLRVEDIQNGKSPAENARAASSAKGAKAGRYSISGNNCEHGADRIVGGRGVSRQVRRAIGGAAVGALAGSTIDRFIRGGRKGKDQ